MEASQTIQRHNFSSPADITPISANPDYVFGGIVPISAVSLALSTIFLALRIYTRVRLLKAFYPDDCKSKTLIGRKPNLHLVDVIIVAWVFSAASTAICLGRPQRIYHGAIT